VALLTVRPGGEEYPLSPAVSILNTLMRNNHPVMHTCGGKAQCGTCRVRILSGAAALSPVREAERLRLGEEKLSAGLRLACQTYAFASVEIEIPAPE
jgi:ferredoxin, 2Fe-2S